MQMQIPTIFFLLALEVFYFAFLHLCIFFFLWGYVRHVEGLSVKTGSVHSSCCYSDAVQLSACCTEPEPPAAPCIPCEPSEMESSSPAACRCKARSGLL